MDDSSRRRRRTATQPDTNSSLQSPSKAAMIDESPYLSPSGRPMRQRSSANLRNASPPSVPTPVPSRLSRASSSRVQKEEKSPAFEEEDVEEEEEEEEDYIEEEAMPSRNRRSTTRTRQSLQAPAAAAPPAASTPPRQQHGTSLRVTLGRNRAAHRTQKRARLAEEDEAGWMAEIDDDDEAQVVYSTIIAKMQSWNSDHPEVHLSDFLDKVPSGTKVSSGR
jgi:glutaredoxin